MRITSVAHVVFAATLLAMGLVSLATGQFGALWESGPRTGLAHSILVRLTAAVSVTGLCLVWRRTAVLASGAILSLLVAWLLVIKGLIVVRTPLVPVVYETAGETAVMAAGAWALFATLAAEASGPLRFVAGQRGLRIAHILYGLALIGLGFAHFAYLKQTAALVPAWLPAHVGWACFTGGAYIAAGLALLAGVLPRLAATLSAVQIGGFTLLVWAPVLIAGSKDPGHWAEAVTSWSLTVGSWLVAASYRDRPWLEVSPR